MSHVPPPVPSTARKDTVANRSDTTAKRTDARRPALPSRPGAVAAAAQISWSDPSQRSTLLILAGLVYLLIVAYWDMFSLTSAYWHEGLYSHGWLVPLGALMLMGMRWQPHLPLPARDRYIGVALVIVGLLISLVAWYRSDSILGLLAFLPGTFGAFLVIGGPFEPVPAIERWIGLGLLAAGLLLRLYAAEYGQQPYDRISFMPAIFGVFMLVGGMRVIEWAWPALAILVFMFPWPGVLERAILGNLQKIASICSTFVLQTMGISAFREGNLISMPGMDDPLNIAEACAGLRMATIFGAMAVLMIFLVERPWWDKFVIVLSAIPIALVVNIIRITVTGLIYMWVGHDSEFARKLGHDWAGYFMMPLALGFLWLELQILERVTVPVDSVQIKPVGGGRGVPVPAR